MSRYAIAVFAVLPWWCDAAFANPAQALVLNNPDSIEKEIEDIGALCNSGDVDAVTARLAAMIAALEGDDVPRVVRITAVRAALETACWSPVDANKNLQQVAGNIGVKAVVDARFKELADPSVIEQQLKICLEILPRTAIPPVEIATRSLVVWNDMLAAQAHYASELATLKLRFPEPPLDYPDLFVHGMSPEAITDPVFRKEYENFLVKQAEQMEWSNNRHSLRMSQEHFLPSLVEVLRTAYAGAPETETSGAKAIRAAIVDQAMREELLKAIRPETKSLPAKETGGTPASENQGARE